MDSGQRAAFKAWVEHGGAYVGLHGAGGDPAAARPPMTTDLSSPIMKGLPRTWRRTDEWYAFATNPRQEKGFHVLAVADETTYAPGRSTMGADHPMIWWHCVGQGHMLFSALGHAGWEYWDPDLLRLLDNSMAWGMRQKAGQGCSE